MLSALGSLRVKIKNKSNNSGKIKIRVVNQNRTAVKALRALWTLKGGIN